MKVEIQFTKNCSNYPRLIKQTQQVLSELSLDVKIQETEVLDEREAERVEFLGSPTLLINGKDLENQAVKHGNYG